MTYKEYLEKIRLFSPKTIFIYLKYSHELNRFDLDYQKLLISKSGISNNTRRIIVSAIKCYYKFLNDKRHEELSLPKKEINVHDFVSFQEYKEYLLKINKKTKMGFQKYIIIRMLFETGVRASELLNMRIEDIRGNKIVINGKGKRQRVVTISNWLCSELMEYVRSRNGQIILFKFGYKNLYNKISILDKTRKLSPHMFRRGYARYCYSKEVSIYDISLSMGHSSIETTATYISRKSEDVLMYKVFE